MRRLAARAGLGMLAFSLAVLAVNVGPAQAATVTFTDTNYGLGTCSNWTVPDGVSAVRITATGTAGTSGMRVLTHGSQAVPSGKGGAGGVVSGTLSGLMSGDLLRVCVDEGSGGGGPDPDGGGGGIGGGASSVAYFGATIIPVVVAGGGGGGGDGGCCGADQGGGDAGLPGGLPGEDAIKQPGALGGGGGSQTQGGAGGAGDSSPDCGGDCGPGRDGTGFDVNGVPGKGGYGGQIITVTGGGGGGGGGGYYGGGGGGSGATPCTNCYGGTGGAGGGGGSDFCAASLQPYAVTLSGCADTSYNSDPDYTTASVVLTYPVAAPTTVGSFQHWGSTSGTSITVPTGATGEYDTAQVDGSVAAPESGTLTFRLYSDPTCSGSAVVPASTKTAVQIAAGSSQADSDPVTQQLPAGTYYWKVDYSGDSANEASASNCGDEVLTVQPPQPTTLSTVQVWGNSTRGASITVPGSATDEHDEATLSGANASTATGTLTFRLFRRVASGPQCTGTPVFTSTQALLAVFGGGTSSQPVPTTLAPDTYYWKVDYSGDSANEASASNCGDEVLTVAALRISPYGGLISTQALTLSMSCSVPPCKARITVTLITPLPASDARHKAKAKPPVITLARGTVAIRKRGRQTVRLRLTAAGRRVVASHHGQVTVNAAVAITIHGHTGTFSQRLKIKIIKPSSRHQR